MPAGNSKQILDATGWDAPEQLEEVMQISKIMSSKVQIANPNQSIKEVAKLMAQCDCGALPVGDNDRLVGVITDRDIAVRAVAAGKSPDTPVRDIMTKEVLYCFEDDDHDAVATNMGEVKVRRLPVLDAKKRLVGIVSLADIAVRNGPQSSGAALCGISKPGGDHSQTAAA
jgi:CBS domain-containing protein